MRTQLIFLRHAQALDKEHGQTDFDRELSERGRRQAKQVADYLPGNLLFTKGICLVSFAARTIQTYEITVGNSYPEFETVFDQIIYDGRIGDIEALIYRKIGQVGDGDLEGKVLIFIGHNPTISFLAERFGYAAGNSFHTATAVSLLLSSEAGGRPKFEKTLWRFDPAKSN